MNVGALVVDVVDVGEPLAVDPAEGLAVDENILTKCQ